MQRITAATLQLAGARFSETTWAAAAAAAAALPPRAPRDAMVNGGVQLQQGPQPAGAAAAANGLVKAEEQELGRTAGPAGADAAVGVSNDGAAAAAATADAGSTCAGAGSGSNTDGGGSSPGPPLRELQLVCLRFAELLCDDGNCRLAARAALLPPLVDLLVAEPADFAAWWVLYAFAVCTGILKDMGMGMASRCGEGHTAIVVGYVDRMSMWLAVCW